MYGEALDSNSCEIMGSSFNGVWLFVQMICEIQPILTHNTSNTAAWSVLVRPLFTADIFTRQGRESHGVISYINGGLVPFS